MNKSEIREVIQGHMNDIKKQYETAETEYAKGNMQQAYITSTHIYNRLTHQDEKVLYDTESLIYKDLLKDAEENGQ